MTDPSGPDLMIELQIFGARRAVLESKVGMWVMAHARLNDAGARFFGMSVSTDSSLTCTPSFGAHSLHGGALYAAEAQRIDMSRYRSSIRMHHVHSAA